MSKAKPTNKRFDKITNELDKLDKLGGDLSEDGRSPIDELDLELIKIGKEILKSSKEIRRLVKLSMKGAKNG